MDRSELLQTAVAIYVDFQRGGRLAVESAVEQARDLLSAVDAACEIEHPQVGALYKGADGSLYKYVGPEKESGFLKHVWMDSLSDLLHQVPEVKALVEAVEPLHALWDEYIDIDRDALPSPNVSWETLGRVISALRPFRESEDA
jgi:hypothetical protein